MFGPTRYLAWARRFYGQVRYDLASSGIPSVPSAELGAPPPSALDDPHGWERLRAAIAHHNAVPEAECIAALGTTHALWLAYASLTSPGDDVLVESPTYEPLVRIAEGVGARVVPFPRDPAAGCPLDPDAVARAMTPRTRAVVVANLHNPTGARASDDALRAVAALAARQGAFLVVDEVYAPFDAMVNAAGVFDRSARRLAPNVVVASSLTKCWGLGNHRIGWVLGPPEVVARAEDAITASCGMLPLGHAHLAVHAFGRVPELSERTRRIVAGKRERVARWVGAQGFEWHPPAEGIFGFVRVPGAGDLTPTIERAAREREVLVGAGAFFGMPDGFRVAWSAPVEALDEGLARLAEALREARC